MPSPSKTVRARPAETAGAGATIAGLAVAIADRNWLAAAVATAGLLPGIVTAWRLIGGLRGVRTFFMTGRGAP